MRLAKSKEDIMKDVRLSLHNFAAVNQGRTIDGHALIEMIAIAFEQVVPYICTEDEADKILLEQTQE